VDRLLSRQKRCPADAPGLRPSYPVGAIGYHGFVGGSATAEIGGDTFAILGLGRTNLRDYYPNFDPNDAITFGIGSRALPKTALTLFTTLDLFQKSGRTADEVFITGNGFALAYDFQPYFVRLAWDPHVNFTNGDMTRVSFGRHF
jgi:hypothetical protein